VAVVAGATSDVGRSICLGLASAGAHLCLLGRDTDALEDLATTLGSHTDGARIYRVDLTVDSTLVELGERLDREVGRVDVLVHSAGAFEMGAHAGAAIDNLDR